MRVLWHRSVGDPSKKFYYFWARFFLETIFLRQHVWPDVPSSRAWVWRLWVDGRARAWSQAVRPTISQDPHTTLKCRQPQKCFVPVHGLWRECHLGVLVRAQNRHGWSQARVLQNTMEHRVTISWIFEWLPKNVHARWPFGKVKVISQRYTEIYSAMRHVEKWLPMTLLDLVSQMVWLPRRFRLKLREGWSWLGIIFVKKWLISSKKACFR